MALNLPVGVSNLYRVNNRCILADTPMHMMFSNRGCPPFTRCNKSPIANKVRS